MSSAGVTLSPVRSEPPLSLVHTNPCADPYPAESIVVYLSLSGTMVPMRVLESDSIQSVKLRIQSYRGFVVRNQKLVCSGRELARSNSNIREYGVSDGNILHLVLKVSNLQVLEVKTTCGKHYTFHVERGRNIGYVKKQIARKGKDFDDPNEQEILYEGEKLEDQRLVDDICRNNDTVLHLVVRKPAKVHPRPVEKNFELSIVAPQVNDGKDYDVTKKTNGIECDVGEAHGAKSRESNGIVLPRKPSDHRFSLDPVIVNPKAKLPLVVSEMMVSASDGLERGNSPVRSREGTGGAYFMQDSSGQKFVAVFKPIDEEPMAVNNPHGLPTSLNGEGLKKGTKVGEGALREVAAYILDHPKGGRRSLSGEERGFAGVPPTTMIKCLHHGFNHPKGIRPKMGSLQMFMENSGSCEELGPAAFPVEEVHKISVLDIRLANTDRHGGNILLSKDEDGRNVLVPIDHGYCLPESFEDCTFEWLYWPQARKPFSLETVDYIRSLNAEEDIALLKFHGWNMPLECARTLRISTMLLKKGVDRGLTAFDIGNFMCRETLTKETLLEEIVSEAEESLLPGTSEAAFLDTLSVLMDRRLDEMVRSQGTVGNGVAV
ncbi:PREDICTED: phosphatidylinositol 4-kinase gamma 4-like [Tarenaya hassleriana]|uniref:phosphatidylinositol 4-kinase gamma 4-like n=1 Tax=Tarenaya hassleriana TaxID=28532 RepID=UPI00053C1534|nr:PREDICTED: phosphatidylinositol 4-kinase gamma 4-like [Tarenaya hassleriana]XP_019058509.1 PREDICTED: phosphatidylinositol 4-kinase gamma 4-like [Tarenaya hassleriana]